MQQRELWTNETKSKTIIEVNVSSLSISEYNPRKQREADYVQRLADRIKVNGYEITRAMWAYRAGDGYKVFAGGTRLQAARAAKLETVPIVLHTGFSDDEIVHLADDDNKNDEYHEPVGLVDMWMSYKTLADKPPLGPGWSQERIARAKGCKQGDVSQRIKYACFPQSVLNIIETYSLTESHAHEISKILNFNNLIPWLTRETALLYVVDQALKSIPTAQIFKEQVDLLNEVIALVTDAIKRLPADRLLPMLAKDEVRTKRKAQNRIDKLTTIIAVEKRKVAEEARARADAAEKVRIEAERQAREAAHRVLIETMAVGQWWKLGEHFLYCGDTSEPEFYEKLPHAVFAFADPPYNANTAEWDNDFNWAHDWLIDKADIVAVTPGISSIFDFAQKTAMRYRWSIACWIKNGMTRGALGFGNWIYTAIFSNLNSIHMQKQDFIQTTISTSKTGETAHKGRKPAGYMEQIVEMFSAIEDWIVDPFGGSGSTLFACEAKDRRCILGELSPEFCKEIIYRWEAMTGKEAKNDVHTIQ